MFKVALYLSLTILVFASCSDAGGSGARRVELGTIDRTAGAYPVETLEVEEERVVEWIPAVGAVTADKGVTLSAEVGGRVTEISANVGDTVRAGGALALLDDERSRIARDTALAEVEIAEVNLANSTREAEREATLFKDKIASAHSIDRAELKAKIAAGQLKIARAALAAAERNLADATIVSPIDGEITRRRIETGELVQQGDPLFDIVNIDRVKVIVQVSERDITRIHKGQYAEIGVDGFPGIVFEGSVNTIGAEADEQTRTFPVEILVINNRPERLLPGFIGRVRIRGSVFEKSIFVSREIVVMREGKPVIFVVTGGAASAMAAELGFESRGKVLVESGLSPGDEVVVTGQESLQDGSRVVVRRSDF